MKTNPEITAQQTKRIRATPYRTADRALCPLCEKPVKLLSFSEAADLFKTDTAEIENLAKIGKLHRIHNNRGRVMICAEALFCLFEIRPTQILTLKTISAGASKA
jgi:hypothetical protein